MGRILRSAEVGRALRSSSPERSLSMTSMKISRNAARQSFLTVQVAAVQTCNQPHCKVIISRSVPLRLLWESGEAPARPQATTAYLTSHEEYGELDKKVAK